MYNLLPACLLSSPCAAVAMRVSVALICGLASLAAAPGIGLWWVSLVAAAPIVWLCGSARCNALAAFLIGAALNLPGCVLALEWTCSLVSGIESAGGLILMLLSAALLGLGAVLFRWLATTGWTWAVAWPTAVFLIEELLDLLLRAACLTTGDSLRLAVSHSGSSPLRALAAIGGMPLVTWAAALASAGIAASFRARTVGSRASIGWWLVGGILLAMDFQALLSRTPGPSIMVTVIPRAVEDFSGVAAVHASLPDIARSELVVWPEVALQQPFVEEARLPAQDCGDTGCVAPVLIGCRRWSRSGGGVFNSVLLLHNGRAVTVADKTRLSPLEQTPPLVWRVVRSPESEFDRGAGHPALVLPSLPACKVAIAICHEIYFPEWVFECAVRSNIAVHVADEAVANSTWAWSRALACVRLRAIESGKPIVRSALGGVSAVIGADGAIAPAEAIRSAQGQSQSFTCAVPLATGKTIYCATHAAIGYVAASLAPLGMWSFRRSRARLEARRLASTPALERPT